MKYPPMFNAVWSVGEEDYKCTFNEADDARSFLDAIRTHPGVTHLRLVRIDFVEQPTMLWDGEW